MKHLKKINKKVVYRLIISSLIFLLIIAIAYIILKHFNLTNVSKEQIHNYISSLGIFGPIAYMLIVFLQVTFIPIPGIVVILAGNICFGFLNTFLYCFISMILGSLLSFKLGRLLGRPFVNWLVGDKQTVNNYLNKVHGKEFVVFFYMFLFPLFPDDALCALAGITPLKYSEFLLMQLISRPLTILFTLFFMSGNIIPFNKGGIIILIILVILSIIVFVLAYKNADKITDYFNKLINKFTSKKQK